MNELFGNNIMRIVLASLLLAVGRLGAEDTSTTNRDWVHEPFSSQFAEFGSVTVSHHPSDKNLVAAYCESEKQWWGHLRVFKHSGDKIEWAATFPKEYIEERGQYIVSCQWIFLSMVEGSVLELIESSHRGNGSLWVMELRDHEFRVLLHTSVRGQYWNSDAALGVPFDGEAFFAGDHLNVEYRKVQGEKFANVLLTGSVIITDMNGKNVSSKPYEQQCTWDSDKRVFTVHAPKFTKPAEQGAAPPTAGATHSK